MPILTLTSTAQQKIKDLCVSKDKYAVRLGIRGGGCAGFSYDWGFADESEIESGDEIIQVEGGRLVVDSHSVMYLFGTEIDYVNEVFGSQFEIHNPNTKSACGCGESIQFDMDRING
jgi:iron-sulfur cluster assembly protein